MNKPSENPFFSEANDDENIDFRQILSKYISNWPWFLFSLMLFLGGTYLYIKYATPVFQVTARLLINDDKKSAGAGSEMLGDLGGLLGGSSTVDNEVEVLKTRYLMGQVVKDLQLNVTYFKEGTIKSTEVYFAPFIVKPIDINKKAQSFLAQIKFIDGKKFSFKTDDLDTVFKYGDVISISGVGSFQILKNPNVPIEDAPYSFTIVSEDNEVSLLTQSLTAEIGSKMVTIIDLTLNSTVPEKGEDVLTRLIFNYVQGKLQDKNEVADSTIAFIKRRLLIIGSELGDAEGNIQGFKQKNSLADMSEQGKLLVTTSGQYTSDLAKVETQISIINSILVQLKDNNANKRVLPSTLMPADLVFGNAVENYNALLLQRGKMLIGLTETNPIIVNLDKQISNSRADIEANLTSTLNGLQITKDKILRQVNAAEGQIQQVPATERNYLKLARQQQIKQELYIFLMQKSEETAISKTANIATSKTIDPPRADIKPISPKQSILYLCAALFGLLFPIIVLYIRDVINNKVDTREDVVRKTDVDIIGEISRDYEKDNLIVTNHTRSQIAEQFRALRTNLSFYLKSESEKVILLTSSMSGEGKSFLSINLGAILALSGKKVLLMELDLRKPGLTLKLGLENNKPGFTNYIISKEQVPTDIIQPISENLYLMSSGLLPPNPAEILLSERTKMLFEQLRKQFDYIIVDAPPIGLVTDAQLLSQYGDITLYVVRMKYTLKAQLNIVQELYKSKKMSKMGIVINDIQDRRGGYGSYGYGYGYGYGTYGGDDIKKGLLGKLKG
jgi:tyrosine-protein kinase Etk/Wzc